MVLGGSMCFLVVLGSSFYCWGFLVVLGGSFCVLFGGSWWLLWGIFFVILGSLW